MTPMASVLPLIVSLEISNEACDSLVKAKRGCRSMLFIIAPLSFKSMTKFVQIDSTYLVENFTQYYRGLVPPHDGTKFKIPDCTGFPIHC